MTSPFPGMDPYLEDPAIWPDFHLTMIVALRADLNSRLPAGYAAAADRHVWIEDPKGRKKRWRDPDVFVSSSKKKQKMPSSAANLAVAEPRIITIPMQDRKGKPFLKILDSQERRVVTVIELLSPANKSPGVDRNSYLEKREEYFAAGVNLVEVNLLRKGKCPPLEENVAEDYYILVCRSRALPKAEIWSFGVRQPIPDTPLPLRSGKQIVFNLRPCLDRAYQEARYDREIDYTKPPYPSLTETDIVWAKELLRTS